MAQQPRLRLQRKIEKLKSFVLTLGTKVEENVQLAVRAIRTRDKDLAKRVIESDHDIDAMEVDLEEECLEILALHQPVASDLRFIVGIFKINQNLERIGDMAANIARNALDLRAEESLFIPRDYFIMADEVVMMLRKSLDAFVSLNSHEAFEVLAQDDHVDLKKHRLHGEFVERLRHEPERTRALTLLFLVSRHLERIGDHATNIAEDVIYMVTGKVSP
jgi:phosphate transport system protein